MTRSVFTSMVLGASLLSGAAMHAATPAATVSQPAVSHARLVRFSLRNDSPAPLKVLAGEQTMTLLPGKTVSVKLAAGLNIVAADTTPKRAAGTVLLQVSGALGNATVSLE